MVGAQPAMEIIAKENLVTIMDHVEGKRTEEFVEDPMGVPKQVMQRWNPQLLDGLPEIFCGEMIFAVLVNTYCHSFCLIYILLVLE